MAALSLRLTLFSISVLCLSCVGRAQSARSVKVSGVVSGTVAITIPQGAEAPGTGVRTTSSRKDDRSLVVVIVGTTRELTEVRIPVQIRSNTSYRLFAAVETVGSSQSTVFVAGARPTGKLVSPDAAEALKVAATFDGRRGAERSNLTGEVHHTNLSTPSELLSGPRISTGGTLTTPHNALEVTLLVTVQPLPDDQGWTVKLMLSDEILPVEP